jgi:hypothetical protein
MKAPHIASLTLLALLGAMVESQLSQAADTPKMGGGYTDVIAIPVIDPAVTRKQIENSTGNIKLSSVLQLKIRPKVEC